MKNGNTFVQSKNWWQPEDLDWFIKNASFAFTTDGHKGYRVRIVTKKPLYTIGENDFEVNCFEFDNDQYGIIITSETRFTEGRGESIIDRTTDVIPMLIKFLNEWGAGEFVNPKNTVRHVINSIRNKHKIIFIKNGND